MTLDSTLSMESQVVNGARTAFFHLRQLVPYLSTSDLATVIHATVTSRLDFCNLLYAGLPLNLLQKLPTGAKCGSPGPYRDPVESSYNHSAL